MSLLTPIADWWRRVMCKHPFAVGRLELIPGQEYARYFFECPDCDAEWEDE